MTVDRSQVKVSDRPQVEHGYLFCLQLDASNMHDIFQEVLNILFPFYVLKVASKKFSRFIEFFNLQWRFHLSGTRKDIFSPENWQSSDLSKIFLNASQ